MLLPARFDASCRGIEKGFVLFNLVVQLAVKYELNFFNPSFIFLSDTL